MYPFVHCGLGAIRGPTLGTGPLFNLGIIRAVPPPDGRDRRTGRLRRSLSCGWPERAASTIRHDCEDDRISKARRN
jgi:hypothetical protein